MSHFSDNLFAGNAPIPGSVSDPYYPANPQGNEGYGAGPVNRVYVYDIVPATVATANVAALQVLGGAGAMVLTAGAGVTSVVNAKGETVLRLDVPRALSFTSAGNISAVNFTVTGYTDYGEPITQTRAGPNANTVNTLKAFRDILSISADAAVGTNTSVGTADVFGLPYFLLSDRYVLSARWAAVAGFDTGTIVAGVVTNPNTAALGDTRGTYAPSSASNGSRRLTMAIYLGDEVAGPTAQLYTTSGANGALGVVPV